MAKTEDKPNTQYAARFNDEVVEQIEQYRATRGMNKSDAIRTLVKTGLKVEEGGFSLVEALAGLYRLSVSAAVLSLVGWVVSSALLVVGFDPVATVELGAITVVALAIAGLVALLAWGLVRSGVAARADRAADELFAYLFS